MDSLFRLSIARLGVIILALALVGAIALHRLSTAPGELMSDRVLIPAGPFTLGSSEDPDARPRHTAYLESFYIDRYEVTNAQYARFLNATDGLADRCAGHICADTRLENPESHIVSRRGHYRVEEGYAHHPVTNVSWYGAQAYCRYYGGRLPTEAEWEKAARSSDGRTYPWGDSPDPGNLNAGNRIGDTKPIGSYPGGMSPYGVHDLAGNVWEWTADWYEPYPGSSHRSPFYGEKYKVLRGGSWNHPDRDARVTHRDIAHPARRIHVVGFRCARDRQ